MITKAKSNSVITHALDGANLTFMVAGSGNVVLNLEALSAAVKQRAMIHGMIQRISDAAALSRDTSTGKPASPADKLAAMRALIDHYATGTSEWSRKREGGTRTVGDTGLLIEALLRMGKVEAKVREAVSGYSRGEIQALLANPSVKVHADAIRAERASDIDSESMLNSL